MRKNKQFKEWHAFFLWSLADQRLWSRLAAKKQMLGTSNHIGLVFKPRLSSLKHQSSSTVCFSGLFKEMISVSQLPHLLLLQCYSQCSTTLVGLDCFPKSSPYTGLDNQLAKRILNPSQLAVPSNSTANQGFTCQMFSATSTTGGKQRLNLSWKVVSLDSSLLLSSLHKTALEEGSLQSGCTWTSKNIQKL